MTISVIESKDTNKEKKLEIFRSKDFLKISGLGKEDKNKLINVTSNLKFSFHCST